MVCQLSKTGQVTFDIEILTSDSGLGAVAVALPDVVSAAALTVGQSMSPSIIEKAADGIGVSVAEDLGGISGTWSPLLVKVQLFSELMDTFADVGFLFKYFSLNRKHFSTDTSLCEDGLERSISCP